MRSKRSSRIFIRRAWARPLNPLNCSPQCLRRGGNVPPLTSKELSKLFELIRREFGFRHYIKWFRSNVQHERTLRFMDIHNPAMRDLLYFPGRDNR